MPDVSPSQGHGSLAPLSVIQHPVPSSHHSSKRPTLFSQFRGPFVFNETDEERQKREEEERKKVEDEEKKSNFRKVQEAREAAEARAEEAERKLREREESDRKAEEAKLTEEKRFEELAKTKEAEANAKADEAAREKARADAAEAKVKAFEDQQEAELAEILKGIPEEKKPPLRAIARRGSGNGERQYSGGNCRWADGERSQRPVGTPSGLEGIEWGREGLRQLISRSRLLQLWGNHQP